MGAVEPQGGKKFIVSILITCITLYEPHYGPSRLSRWTPAPGEEIPLQRTRDLPKII